jgi:mono/diheme cytochrome c family protein
MRVETLIASAAIAALVTAAVALAGDLSTKDGAFTREQAERGKAVYDKSCVTCHPAEFYREQLGRWQNKPVAELFEVVSTTMPSDKPGALLTSEYVDVLAYVFSITGAPAGSNELTTDNMESINVGPVQ